MKTWCEPLKMPQGHYVYGGAARNVRIANAGGMNAILTRIFEEASSFKHVPKQHVGNVIPLRSKMKRAA
ncbi:hypothetical protein CRN80_08405 [Pseudomonas sp. FDAARGOS_380]|uniref:hypothetical protein n=1 Tax=unclassified Pseudomonas TaxID=196821 RepID=UPI000BFB3B51|nr:MULTISPECIES: hypothetical protein [unclassified Pseudomonas]ATN09677.1 hypothetical protein CRN80_08405 [Pseudomonas sp. FDAARGOS_380]NMX28270.1 hypothetical protein [Pseudomonas sp. WS 5406]